MESIVYILTYQYHTVLGTYCECVLSQWLRISQNPIRDSVADSGWFLGFRGNPFGLHLALISTDYEVLIDRLNGTPLSVYRTKETTAMAHLGMENSFKNRSIGLVGLIVSPSKTIEMGVAS